MKSNFDNNDILLNPDYVSTADLNSDQFRILIFIAANVTKCDLVEDLGGQTISKGFLEYRLEQEEGFKSSTISYALKKLENSNIIKYHKRKNLYQLNPSAVWVPYNPDSPGERDSDSFELLKQMF